jgi:class 3 adenylate cyclase
MEIIHRVNHRHNLQLTLSIGINTGPAIAGIVGKQKFIYDLWGDTVTLAGRMQSAKVVGNIKLTQAVREALGDLHTFEQAGELELPGKGSQAIWVLKTS